MATGGGVDPGLLSPGSEVDHFRIVRLLGRGGMGEVYLARDGRLGRKVALKIVRSLHARSREAAARFLLEARATARFSHPHIVAIYAVGEHGGLPYVALEYLEGLTLRQRMRQERLGPMEGMRIGLAIAEALAESHRNGVLHRDLKPENVLLPRDGRVRVVDFGLAQLVTASDDGEDPEEQRLQSAVARADAETPSAHATELSRTALLSNRSRDGAICGTPRYMAPEQWLGQACSGGTDVWALGLILFEMLSGRVPYRERRISKLCAAVISSEPVPDVRAHCDVPNECTELITCCLAKDPAARPTASSVAQDLSRLLHIGRREPSDEGPFRGLRPFDERHAGFFFGRDMEIAAFVERLRLEAAVPIVGPSGAGKSSFVRAGVIPRLREQGPWTVVALRPTGDPFHTLAARLLHGEAMEPRPRSFLDELPTLDLDGGQVAGSVAHGETSASGTLELARHLARSPGLLGLVLRRLCEAERCRVLLFVDQLEEAYTAVQDETVRRSFMRAICTAADDPQEPVRVVFTVREDFLGRLAAGLEVRQMLGSMTLMVSPDADALARTVTEPLRLVGYRVDDPSLVPEMVAAVGDQSAALPLLQFTARLLWDRRDRERHLLRRETYESLGGVAGALARHANDVLQALGPPQVLMARQILLALVTAAGTRRVLTRAEVLAGIDEDAGVVLDGLVQGRLIAATRTPGQAEEGTFEIAHESLIRTWGRLARWVDESREELTRLADAEQAAELWERRSGSEDSLWQGTALAEAFRALEHSSTRVPPRVRRFLTAGRRHERRRQRRKRLLVGGVIALLTAVALISLQQKDRAERQHQRARSRWAEAQREGARAALIQGDLLESRAKVRGSLEVEDSLLARGLWWQVEHDPRLWQRRMGTAIYDLAFSPDGRLVAAACHDRSVQVLDTTTMAVKRVLRDHEDQVVSVAFSPDGRRLASSTWTGSTRLWDLGANGSMRRLTDGPAWSLSFSPDGRRLAHAAPENLVRVLGLETGAQTVTLKGHTAPVSAVALGPDASWVASASRDGTVRLWPLAQEAAPRVLVGHRGRVHDVSVSPDGKLVASSGADKTIRLWRVWDGAPVRVLRGHTDRVYVVSFSPGGHQLASGSADRTIRLWDLDSRRPPGVLRGQQAGVHAVAFSPDGRRLASGGYDGMLRLWDATPAPRPEGSGHAGGVLAVTFSPDSRRLASGGTDATVRLWNMATGEQERTLTDHGDRVYGVVFAPDGAQLASASADGTVHLWDLEGHRAPRSLAGHSAVVHALAMGPNGRYLASGSADRTIRIWDLQGKREPRVLTGHAPAVHSLRISPDGNYLAAGGFDGTIRVWDLASDTAVVTLRGHTSVVNGLAFHPTDRGALASAGQDGTIRLWRLPGGVGRIVWRHGDRLLGLDYHSSGRQMAAACADGTVRLWLPDRPEPIALRHPGHPVRHVSFSPDGLWLASADDGGVVRLWHASTGRPHWRAPVLLRDTLQLLTHRGWVDLRTNKVRRGVQQRWRRAAEERGWMASVSGSTLCVQTLEGELEAWDREGDRLLFQRSLPGVEQVLALPGACVSRARGSVQLHRSMASRRLASSASAMAIAGHRILVASGRRVHTFTLSGEPAADYTATPGAQTLALGEEGLVLGHRNGQIEVIGATRAPAGDQPFFEGVPPSPVTLLAHGPMRSLLAGYGDGSLRIWSLEGGAPLVRAKLHGPVRHVALVGNALHVATELGDHQRVDLDALQLGYCELLRRVWGAVPVLWRAGRAIQQGPDPDHRCIRRAK